MSHLKPHHCLLIAAAGGCLGFATPVAADPLSLEEAILAALHNNFTGRIAAFEPQIAADAVEQERGAFDIELFANAQARQTERATTFSQTDGTSVDNRSLRAGARMRMDTGTSITAQSVLNRSATNAGVATSNLTQEADFSVSIRQPLLQGSGRTVNRARLEQALAGVAGAEESFRDAVLRVLAQTESAYWQVARWQAQLELSQSNLEVAEAFLSEAQERERVGLTTRLEVLQAQASQAQRTEELIVAERNLDDAVDALYLQMGILHVLDARMSGRPQVNPLPQRTFSVPEFDFIWQAAQANDPALAAQEAVIRQNELAVKVADSNTLPSLDLVLSGGFNGLDNQTASNAISGAIDRDGHMWSVGLEFSMPLGQRSERAAQRSASARLEREIVRYELLRQNLYRETRARYRALESVQKSLAAAELTVALQEATFEQETGKYEEGMAVFRDVLQAQRDLDQARIRLLQSRLQQIEAEIELQRMGQQLLDRYGLPDVRRR